jgi:hypothetical protein
MPHLRPLDALRVRLHAEMSARHISHAVEWGNPRVMTEALRNVQRDLAGDGDRPPTDDLLNLSLQKFFKTQQVTSFNELKYVCFGVTVPVGKDLSRLIDKPALLGDLLSLVSVQNAQPRKFRRCYQGLLTGYFGFDRYATTDGDTGENWQNLRSYLNDHLLPMRKVAKARGTAPDWLQTLYEHKNLLSDDPCSRYATGLSRGDATELREIFIGLGIAGSSWVWQDALMGYVRHVCAFADVNFLKGLTRLLDLIGGRGDITLPAALAIQATAMVVIRYCSCASQPEHNVLRDTCIHWIGNPWINRTAWDAHVNHEPARQMVNGWLKRRLIKDFFELLAQDGSADLRRLNYWLKWEPQITDMWFVMGTNARENHSEPFMELRKRMTGRDRILNDNNHQNNAFVMRIGQLLVIEFGVTNNACFVFAASDFRTSLDRKLFMITDLKQKIGATRLSHMSHWEGRFDYELRRLLQSVPMSKGVLNTPEPTSTIPRVNQSWVKNFVPASTELISTASQTLRSRLTQEVFNNIQLLCQQHGVEWESNLPKKGALWVLIPDRKQRVGFASILDRYGFRYTDGKGFWIKDEN